MIGKHHLEHKNSGITIGDGVLIAVVPLLLLVFIVAAYYFLPITYLKIVTEDYWGEWTTFVAFLLAAGIFGRLFIKSRPKATGTWYALLAFASFFIAMEEISWGQRLFSLSVPELFEQKNFQQEITLHNIQGFWSNEWTNMRIAGILFILYGLVLPVLVRVVRPIRELCAKVYLPVPSLSLSPHFVLVFYFFIFQPVLLFQEIGEMYMALGIYMLAIQQWLFSHAHAESNLLEKILNKRSALLAVLSGVLALLASRIFTPEFVAGHLSADGALHEHTIKLIRSYQKIALILGGILFLGGILLFVCLQRGGAQTGSIAAGFIARLSERKGVAFAGFALCAMVLGYAFMESFAYEIGFKNTLNDFATQKLYQKGMYRQAEALFRFIDKNPHQAGADLLMFRGRNDMALGRTERGRQRLQQAMAIALRNYQEDTTQVESVLKVARINAFSGDSSQAHAWYQRAIELESNRLAGAIRDDEKRSIYMKLGEIFGELGQYSRALAEFEKAREVSQSELELREAKIRIYRTQNLLEQ